MKNFLQYIASIALLLALLVTNTAIAVTYQTPDTVALFETTLASRITSSATSMTLTSATTKDGSTLATSTYGFIIDEGTASEEIVLADCTATACTNMVRGVSVLTGTSSIAALKKEHRRGASVKITDAPILLFLTNILKGRQIIENPIRYDSSVSTTTLGANTKNLVDVAYVTSAALNAGSVLTASETNGGFVELALGQEAASTTLTGTAGRLALSTAISTSTKPSSGHYVPVTDISGEISSTFIPTIAQNTPAGVVFPYASSTAPTGFLNADGTAVSRTTYATLFNVVGTTYGTGDGSTTFNLPDLRARVPVGYSSTNTTKVWTFSSRTSNTITVTGATNATSSSIQTGQPVVYVTSGSVITGLTSGNTYYMIRSAYNQFLLATTVNNANDGTSINLSSDGSGTQTFTATYNARPMAETGGTETTNQVASHRHTSPASDGSTSGSGSGAQNTDGVTGVTGGEPNNMQLYTVLNYIIKY